MLNSIFVNNFNNHADTGRMVIMKARKIITQIISVMETKWVSHAIEN